MYGIPCLMWTLAELNETREPKIHLIQVWVWNLVYHNERLAPRQQEYKPPNHKAYTWRWTKKV